MNLENFRNCKRKADEFLLLYCIMSLLPQVQKQFWFTKSAVIRRLGKKEDEHVVASDAELDAKIELFKAIESSTRTLQVSLVYHRELLVIKV